MKPFIWHKKEKTELVTNQRHVVRFMGGFANQLFQYAFYCKLVERYDDLVFADLSHYDSNTDHGGFKLDQFFDLNLIDIRPQEFVMVTEKNYDTINYNKSNTTYYYIGFWQSKHFFSADMGFLDKIQEKACESIEEKLPELFEIIKREQSVSVHVRRGDYVNNAMHGNISTKAYYNNAIRYVQNKVINAVYFVFSDDIEWCEDNLKFGSSNVHYVRNNEEYVDLILMSMCKHNIISNSSFSWWAKTLNKNNENKIVIAPPRWFNDSINVSPLDVSDAIIVDNIPYVGTNKIIKRTYVISVTKLETLERCLVSVINQQDNESDIVICGDNIPDKSIEFVRKCEEVSGIRIYLFINKNHKKNYYKINSLISMKDAVYLDSDEFLDECFVKELGSGC